MSKKVINKVEIKADVKPGDRLQLYNKYCKNCLIRKQSDYSWTFSICFYGCVYMLRCDFNKQKQIDVLLNKVKNDQT